MPMCMTVRPLIRMMLGLPMTKVKKIEKLQKKIITHKIQKNEMHILYFVYIGVH